MFVIKYSQDGSMIAEIISATSVNIMKAIRYIRPTQRWTKAQQERATNFEDIAFTVVEGEDGRTFENLRKIADDGKVILVESLEVFARRRDTICERLKALFAKGAYVMDAKGNVYPPEHEAIVCQAVMTGGYAIKEPKERVAHNKTPDDKLQEAEKMWHGAKFKRMTNGEIAAAVGLSPATLYRKLGKRGRDAGRPKQ